jgi:hypothetical protein
MSEAASSLRCSPPSSASAVCARLRDRPREVPQPSRGRAPGCVADGVAADDTADAIPGVMPLPHSWFVAVLHGPCSPARQPQKKKTRRESPGSRQGTVELAVRRPRKVVCATTQERLARTTGTTLLGHDTCSFAAELSRKQAATADSLAHSAPLVKQRRYILCRSGCCQRLRSALQPRHQPPAGSDDW